MEMTKKGAPTGIYSRWAAGRARTGTGSKGQEEQTSEGAEHRHENNFLGRCDVSDNYVSCTAAQVLVPPSRLVVPLLGGRKFRSERL